eukprot:g14120.t1
MEETTVDPPESEKAEAPVSKHRPIRRAAVRLNKSLLTVTVFNAKKWVLDLVLQNLRTISNVRLKLQTLYLQERHLLPEVKRGASTEETPGEELSSGLGRAFDQLKSIAQCNNINMKRPVIQPLSDPSLASAAGSSLKRVAIGRLGFVEQTLSRLVSAHAVVGADGAGIGSSSNAPPPIAAASIVTEETVLHKLRQNEKKPQQFYRVAIPKNSTPGVVCVFRGKNGRKINFQAIKQTLQNPLRGEHDEAVSSARYDWYRQIKSTRSGPAMPQLGESTEYVDENVAELLDKPPPVEPTSSQEPDAYFPATTSSSSTTNARSSSKHVPSGAPPVTQKKYIEGFKPFVQAAKLIKDIKQYKETRERVDKFDRDFNSKPWISPQMKLVIATGVAVHLVLSFIRWRTDPEHFSFYDWGLGQKDPVLDF